ncbi:hypothetical protein PEC18_29320 [Paucibacter sp. O1-1]|nr:hypothetical protein [Paucibacter sp. O1-1]MDA3829841.1 hypothetical protein [Paucibacter sp. O1-1]
MSHVGPKAGPARRTSVAVWAVSACRPVKGTADRRGFGGRDAQRIS